MTADCCNQLTVPSTASLLPSFSSQPSWLLPASQHLHNKSRFLLLGMAILEVHMQWVLENPGGSDTAQFALVVFQYNPQNGYTGKDP